MKNMKKVFALVLVAVMVFALSATAFAQTVDSGKGGPASITITLPTEETSPSGTTTYKIYKVFDATNDGTSSAISYKLVSGKSTAPAGFTVDAAGNVKYTGESTDDQLTAADIAAIKAYVANDEVFYTATVPVGEASVTVTGLPYGYYYITTSTGTVVTIDSTNPNAQVIDKNTIPKPPKKTIGADFAGSVDAAGKAAIAAVGTTVPFSVEIEVEKGAKDYVFHDVMTSGLTYNPASLSVSPAASVANTTTDTDNGDTLTVTFDNDWLAANEGATITITYTATVNSDALSIDYENNTATLDYGEGHTTEKDEIDIYNAKITVVKEDGEGTPLAGAGFILKNSDNKYYVKNADGTITWVDNEDDAQVVMVQSVQVQKTGDNPDTEVVEADDNVYTAVEYQADFKGLQDGNYTLIEKVVPNGYNKAADLPITIAGGDVTLGNLNQKPLVINNEGTELPSTGGIGTTIFYVVGALMMAAAVVLLITKKRVGNVK